jgi:predicted nucleic acid-binding protein
LISAVLDTNVVVSGLAGIAQEARVPGALLGAWLAGDFTLIVSEHILTEVERTLRKPYFASRVDPDDARAGLRALRDLSRKVVPGDPLE